MAPSTFDFRLLMMARVGLEPTRREAQASKTCVSTSFTTGPSQTAFSASCRFNSSILKREE